MTVLRILTLLLLSPFMLLGAFFTVAEGGFMIGREFVKKVFIDLFDL